MEHANRITEFLNAHANSITETAPNTDVGNPCLINEVDPTKMYLFGEVTTPIIEARVRSNAPSFRDSFDAQVVHKMKDILKDLRYASGMARCYVSDNFVFTQRCNFTLALVNTIFLITVVFDKFHLNMDKLSMSIELMESLLVDNRELPEYKLWKYGVRLACDSFVAVYKNVVSKYVLSHIGELDPLDPTSEFGALKKLTRFIYMEHSFTLNASIRFYDARDIIKHYGFESIVHFHEWVAECDDCKVVSPYDLVYLAKLYELIRGVRTSFESISDAFISTIVDVHSYIVRFRRNNQFNVNNDFINVYIQSVIHALETGETDMLVEQARKMPLRSE
jgi:hypothetical protein